MKKSGKRWLKYPAGIWAVFPALAVAAQFESIMGFVLVSIAIVAGSAVWARNKFLHPLGLAGYPYYYWLRTTPYTPDKPLPNGSLMPGWEDGIFVLGLLLVLAMAVDFDWTLTVMCWAALLNFMVLLISFMTVRSLLNVGPRWMAYVICFCVLFAFHIAWRLVKIKTSWEFGLVAPIPAFVASIIGLHLSMQRYPWSDNPPAADAIVSCLTYKEMQNNYSDVTATGRPFTTLKPDGHWPEFPQGEAITVSVLLALTAYLFNVGSWSSTFLLAGLFLLVFWGRLMLYGNAKTDFFTVNAFRRNMQLGQLSHSLMWSVILIILAGLAFVGILNLMPVLFPFRGETIVNILTPIFGGVLCYMAIKLPPSRKTWETIGRWQSDNSPDVDMNSRQKRKSESGAPRLNR